jgi:hypothetical protein
VFMKFLNKIIPSDKKINLNDSLQAFYGKHRSGWLYALEALKSLHNDNGILFDSFIERSFNWHPQGKQIHREPWVGVIHVPPNVPEWFQHEQSNDAIFATKEWQESFPHCKGLFALSQYHKRNLQKKLNIPIESLYFATEEPRVKWEWDRFQQNREKKIIQIGWWLRKLHTIFQLDVNKYKKRYIKITYADVDSVMAHERGVLKKEGTFDDKMYDTASDLGFLQNSAYDELLAENVVILNLYDTSANNLISECMVRNTPILVNPLEAVVEYLGEGYPLYFSSLEEAAEKADNFDLIYDAHQYLKKNPIKLKLTSKYFKTSLAKSEIYNNL